MAPVRTYDVRTGGADVGTKPEEEQRAGQFRQGLVEKEPAPVVWVGWQILPGEKYFGVIERADGSVERTRLERDDLKATADFVTAYKSGNAASIRGRTLRRLT